jgi:hypothetical protein
MKSKLIPLRFNELLCWSASVRRAERLSFPGGNLIADAECCVLSAWADSTRTTIQPTSRIIYSILQSHTRGASGINFVLMRSGDITLELTRAERAVHKIHRGKNLEKDAIEASG